MDDSTDELDEGDDLAWIAGLVVLAFRCFLGAGLDGGGVARGESCGERSELISILIS